MFRKRRIALLAAGLALMAGPAMAGNLVASNCTGCHTSENGEIWGMIKPGSQTDSGFAVTINNTTYTVRYDKQTDLKKFFSAKQLRDDKSVKVVPRSTDGNTITAASISYKGNISFMQPEMVMELDELGNLLKQDPKEANYVLFDVRGYGDYIDGHLPGAVSLPYYRMIQFKDRLPKDKDTLIVTYCNSYG
jgi:hypothetical protein